MGRYGVAVKILDVTEFYSERGGGVRSHLSLKGHVLCQLGHEHVVVAPGARDEVLKEENGSPLARSESRARVIRVRGPASPYDPTYHLFSRFDKIRAIVARERPDVLEIHSPYLAAAGALGAKRGTYGIRTFQWHSDFIDTYAGVLEGKSPLAAILARPAASSLWSLVRGIARRCDAVLVASAWQVDKLTGHGVPRVVHLPFGIERAAFRADARSIDERRELLTLAGRDAAATTEETTPILVSVGRFAIEKRWDVVLDAFFRVREERDAVLVLVGDGPERPRMNERVAASRFARDVVFRGFVKGRAELARLLASADALVHGCPFETFGLSIAEAMSCGLPAVVPDEGGAAEMHDPESGERYRALSVEACAAAVLRMLERIATNGVSIRASAARAASRLPTVREQFAQQVALYTDLLAQRRHAAP
jgi:alpha-1,6-mannosyltransferase